MQDTTLSFDQMVEIFEDMRAHYVLECKFEKRMREVQEATRWNNRGIFDLYETELDYTHFGMGEAGVLQPGGEYEVTKTKRVMRGIWSSVDFTGELNRLKSQEFVRLKEEHGNSISDMSALNSLAENTAIEIVMRRKAQVFQRWKNYYAINGGDNSALGVITGAPGGTDLEFSWATTDHGNRLLKKGMKVNFYDDSASTVLNAPANYTTGHGASVEYSLIDAHVDERASVNVGNNGLVSFDELPTSWTPEVGVDTIHIHQGYAAMPQGFLYHVDDTNTLLNADGTALSRSDSPAIFIPTIDTSGGDLTPVKLAAMESYIRGRMSDDEPIQTEIWANKAQVFNYIKFAYNQPTAAATQMNFQRFADFTSPDKVDVGVPHKGLSYNNIRIEEDVDVPPSKLLWIDWMGWMIDVETPEGIYMYDQNQQLYQKHNSNGEPIDAKQATIFTQYNYRCNKYKTQGIMEGLSYDADQIAQP